MLLTRINSKEEFEKHLESINSLERQRLNHMGGKPERFPCLTGYTWQENRTGADYCHHIFFYQKIMLCPNCGKASDMFVLEEGDEI